MHRGKRCSQLGSVGCTSVQISRECMGVKHTKDIVFHNATTPFSVLPNTLTEVNAESSNARLTKQGVKWVQMVLLF